MPRILYICPTYGQFDYAKKALQTFFQCSGSDDAAMLVDDASPDISEGILAAQWVRQDLKPQSAREVSPRRKLYEHYFPKNGGLTRSWNYGLKFARDNGYRYAICGNSDILFAPHWSYPFLYGLGQDDWQLLGPVTNCPGAPQYGAQSVKHFYPDYQISDDPRQLSHVSDYLIEHYGNGDTAVESHINGFFLMAKTQSWWEGAFDAENVFNPRNDFNSKGQRNPTPLMTLNEDELQRRWRAKGWRIGFSPASFIFHYRAVTRGGHAALVEGAYRLGSH